VILVEIVVRFAWAPILVAGIAAVAVAEPAVGRVKGTIERVIHAQGPCRGGVAVTREEMEEVEAKTQRLRLANATFTVFAGRRHAGKPVTRFRTDRAGRFEVALPEGAYCVMAGDLKEAAPKNAPMAAPTGPHVDAECLRERAVACDAQLQVRKENPRDVKLTLDTFTPCPQPWAQPCYRGPMPP
jgi:hypothetical protein